ncbi:MAG: T9SS type A sorting domain-containing protein [Bacteroidota bacterium]
MKRILLFLSVCCILGGTTQAQECYFLKNQLDTLFQVSPASGIIGGDSLTPDFPRQTIFAYLITIDPIGRRYVYVVPDSPTFSNGFSLKIVNLDSMTQKTVPLSNYQHLAIFNQFSFNGLEYGVVKDELYALPVQGDSLYRISLTTGMVTPVMPIPNFDRPYAYLTTFNQSQQQYAFIGTDFQGNKRFFRVDIDDSTTYVSPPVNLPEPARGLEYSETSKAYYFVSDQDQHFYQLDSLTGVPTQLFPIPNYKNVWGYLHTYDFGLDLYHFIGFQQNQTDSLAIYSISPSTQNVFSVNFPRPSRGYFGFEATNTQFLARLKDELTGGTTTSVQELASTPFRVYPNPAKEVVYVENVPLSRLFLRNTAGQLVREQLILAEGSGEISLTGLAKGVYYLTSIGLNGTRLGAVSILKQ